MASSYSTDLKLELMVTGENAGTWGDITNTNLNLLQQAIGGYQEVSIAGGAQTTTLLMSNAALSNARNAVIKLTGTITGNQIVTVPDGIEKTYIISNGTVGAFTVQFKTVSGTGTTFSTVDKGIKILFADGTNIVDVNANLSVSSFEQINLPNQNELRFEDATGGQYVALKAGTTIATDLTFTLPTADGSNGQALVTNGSGVLSFADAGLAWQSVVTTSTITVVAGRAYFINTTSNACTVTLPSGTPTAGSQIQLVDYAGTFDTNALTINPNGNKIEGGTNNLQLKGEREGVILTYIDATQGWLATSGINEGTDALEPVTYSADFLVIAGGGAGGGDYRGGGGGAGGYRSSNATYGSSGGGGSAEASLTFTPGTVYTVTVGAGGTGVTGTDGNNGNSSSISGTGITTITSTGGGGGGNYNGGSGTVGKTGGSGGGAGCATNNPAGGSGTANQGFGGGNGNETPPYYVGGGGGGAGAVGVASGTGAGGTSGDGGNGVASTITGSSVTRAGGGGGGNYNLGNVTIGGTGGGGAGGSGDTPYVNGTAGTANTGGGGGGSSGNDTTGIGGNGGKGVVILRMPTANYSTTTTGSPTVTTSGSNTILVFNDSGSYTG
jgi:hypothetical protein